MPARRISDAVLATLRRFWPYLVLVALIAAAGGAAWGFRDRWRSTGALYREASAAAPARAARLYTALEARSLDLAEYYRLWSAQASMPAPDAVARLRQVIDYRPDSPAAYHAHLTLARYYAGLESPTAVAEYRAALSLNNTVEIGLELARYLESQNARAGAYKQYLALLGRQHPDAFADLRRTAADPLAVASDLLNRSFYSDVLDILRDEQGCQAHCLRASALRSLGQTEAAAGDEQACQACSDREAATGGEGTAPVVDAQQRLLSSADPVDWWSATWDLDWQATLSNTVPVSQVLPIYLRVAQSGAYVADDAAYRALVLARRQGDVQAEAQALALLESMRPNWYAFLATGDLALALAPPFPDPVQDTLTPDVLRKVAALGALGRDDLATEELTFAARVSETPEVIVRMAQELARRGHTVQAYVLAAALLRDHPYLPVECWKLAYPEPYAAEVLRWGKEYGVEPELIWAVMRQESEFGPEGTSSAGAMGLMQITPGAVAEANTALKTAYAPGDAYLPEVNIRLGAWQLKALLERYKGDVTLALMGYNAGAATVDGWLQQPISQNRDDLLRFIPYGETREYVSRVLLNYLIYRAL